MRILCSLKILLRLLIVLVFVVTIIIFILSDYIWVLHEATVQYFTKPWDFKSFASQFECQHPSWCDTYFNDSEITQKIIFDNQHPANCSTAKFLVFPGEHYAGMGSSIHIKSFFMTIAIVQKRVFILPDNTFWEFGRMCYPSTFSCIFEPITNCSTELHLPDWPNAPILREVDSLHDHRVVRIPNKFVSEEEWVGGFGWNLIPSQFSGKDWYWWHAQISSYTARPNERTKAIVAKEQREVFPPYGIIPHPIISLYVRHADKGSEATLLDFSAYMEVINNFTRQHPNIKDIYIGSDDPEVIDQVLTNRSYSNYNFYFIKEARTNKGAMGELVTDRANELIRVSIANLFIQVQGDVFVGTRSSNFCRLIDELRKTAGKARAPYLTPEPIDQFMRESR